ncbi:MAG: hypothetical protein A2Y07_09135 [Planctomycetes bacterium GWF2_50_10]|nr:MAG: hypothetical protein A2Y07_09135 [Planctomycetes bacterium GWF2_50_10]
MKISVLVGVSLLVMMVSGCQTGAPTCVLERKVLDIESIPSGADVYIYNVMNQKKTLVGQTPIHIPVSVVGSAKGKGTEQMAKMVGKIRVEISKEGFVPYNGIADLRGEKPKGFAIKLNRTKVSSEK